MKTFVKIAKKKIKKINNVQFRQFLLDKINDDAKSPSELYKGMHNKSAPYTEVMEKTSPVTLYMEYCGRNENSEIRANELVAKILEMDDIDFINLFNARGESDHYKLGRLIKLSSHSLKMKLFNKVAGFTTEQLEKVFEPVKFKFFNKPALYYMADYLEKVNEDVSYLGNKGFTDVFNKFSSERKKCFFQAERNQKSEIIKMLSNSAGQQQLTNESALALFDSLKSMERRDLQSAFSISDYYGDASLVVALIENYSLEVIDKALKVYSKMYSNDFLSFLTLGDKKQGAIGYNIAKEKTLIQQALKKVDRPEVGILFLKYIPFKKHKELFDFDKKNNLFIIKTSIKYSNINALKYLLKNEGYLSKEVMLGLIYEAKKTGNMETEKLVQSYLAHDGNSHTIQKKSFDTLGGMLNKNPHIISKLTPLKPIKSKTEIAKLALKSESAGEFLHYVIVEGAGDRIFKPKPVAKKVLAQILKIPVVEIREYLLQKLNHNAWSIMELYGENRDYKHQDNISLNEHSAFSLFCLLATDELFEEMLEKLVELDVDDFLSILEENLTHQNCNLTSLMIRAINKAGTRDKLASKIREISEKQFECIWKRRVRGKSELNFMFHKETNLEKVYKRLPDGYQLKPINRDSIIYYLTSNYLGNNAVELLKITNNAAPEFIKEIFFTNASTRESMLYPVFKYHSEEAVGIILGVSWKNRQK